VGIAIPALQDIRKCVHEGRILPIYSVVLKIGDFTSRTNKRCDIYILVSYVIVCPSCDNLKRFPYFMLSRFIMSFHDCRIFFVKFFLKTLRMVYEVILRNGLNLYLNIPTCRGVVKRRLTCLGAMK